jgi:hypothetical protein
MSLDRWPLIPTKTGFVRLRFLTLHDWSGTVHVTGNVDDPAGSLVVAVTSDALFQGVPFEVRIEESADGVHWAERSRGPRRVDVVAGTRLPAPPARPGRRRARRARRSRG